jgi:hypothetical protein
MDNEESITRLEAALERVEGAVTELRQDFFIFKERVETALMKVTEHDELLKGKGRDVGLVARVSNMDGTLEELRTILKGKCDDPGMVGAIKSIKDSLAKREDTEKWAFRLIGAYMIVEILEKVLPAVLK